MATTNAMGGIDGTGLLVYFKALRDLRTVPRFLVGAAQSKALRLRGELEAKGLGQEAETVYLASLEGMTWAETIEAIKAGD